MDITKESLKAILLYDSYNVSLTLKNRDLHIEWEFMEKKYWLCFKDCIYFEWTDNQASMELHGISLVEESSFLNQLILQSDRLRDMTDYEMYHLQIHNLYGGEPVNIMCHDVEWGLVSDNGKVG